MAGVPKMRFHRVKNQTPESTPPSRIADGGTAGNERFIWEVLAPRLLQPSKLAFIQALLETRQPLCLTELAEIAEISVEHARYQCNSMVTAGVLEVVQRTPRDDGDGDEVSYYFPKPAQAAASPSPAATA
jgi:hypothetical protein